MNKEIKTYLEQHRIKHGLRTTQEALLDIIHDYQLVLEELGIMVNERARALQDWSSE